ncbi:MAG: Qat anti-phage system QueC-like protein QatC [Litorimonas sp.]
MTSVALHHDLEQLQQFSADRYVNLYGARRAGGIAGIGNTVRREFARLDIGVSEAAWDFVSIALGVVAADTFVSRDYGGDGFARDLTVQMPLADPKLWEANEAELSRILRFLTGDNWSFSFIAGGTTPPSPAERQRKRIRTSIRDCDHVCLFSGGMDSLIGALSCIADPDLKPLLVSRSSGGDQKFQGELLSLLGNPTQFAVNDAPQRDPEELFETEGTTRSRSLLFLALASACADAISRNRNYPTTALWIPENGVIALNAPLTNRRIGAASTRTAHPHYLHGIQCLLKASGIRAYISNPFANFTKGEMILKSPQRQQITTLISQTVSCGKFKRSSQQCGKCVPCLIRRAACHKAGIVEPAGTYRQVHLSSVTGSKDSEADVYAVRRALRSITKDKVPSWVLKSGPLHTTNAKPFYDVAWRGLEELRALFSKENVPK